MRIRTFSSRALAVVALSLVAVACGDDDDTASPSTQAPAATDSMSTEPMATDPMTTDAMTTDPMTTDAMMDSSEICDADAIVAAVEGGPAAGTLSGMSADPVGTAASNNPVLTTLTAAVTAAGLVETLNEAPALTVFAPTDCAFAALDPATLEAALADPTGLLTTVLGFHVIPERLSAADLAGVTELTTFTGETLTVDAMGESITLADGQSAVIIGDIQTGNATVFLIDTVMIPRSVG